MIKTPSWKQYLSISLLLFAAFLLEYFAIFVIEVALLGMDISHYSAYEQSIHHGIMAVLWILYVGLLLLYSKKKNMLPHKKQGSITKHEWSIALLSLLCCKILTFIDWHSFKIFGELQGKTMMEFLMQYLYYVMEVGIVVLLIAFGQKAFEIYRKKQSSFPYGGLLLAFTWGIFHFVSRGVGIEIWNGISCMIFSVLSGIIYVHLKRNLTWSYLFIAIGYLL